jgi:PKD repeat protein
MEGNNAFDSVDVVLRDSENAAETVFLRVKKGGDSTASVAVNGLGDFAPVSTSFAGNAQKTYFSIGYDSVKKTFKLDGQKFAVTQTANGETFNGFSSGRVYLTLKINGVYGAAGIGVKKVNNQIITKIVADTIAPEVVFTDFFGMYQKGSELTIAPAYALDVLDPEVRFTLTVTDRHGNAVYAKDGTKLTDADPTVGYTIVLEEYGSYSFIYQAEDTAGRKARYPVAINVRDDVAPVLETAGGYVKTMKVGSTLTVAKATVTDNVDEKLEYTVFLKSPDGQIDVLHAEKAILSAKGVYTLTYMAIDFSGNIATVSYEIMVN